MTVQGHDFFSSHSCLWRVKVGIRPSGFERAIEILFMIIIEVQCKSTSSGVRIRLLNLTNVEWKLVTTFGMTCNHNQLTLLEVCFEINFLFLLVASSLFVGDETRPSILAPIGIKLVRVIPIGIRFFRYLLLLFLLLFFF